MTRKRIYRLRVLTGFGHKKGPSRGRGLENMPHFTPLRAPQSPTMGLYRVLIPPKTKSPHRAYLKPLTKGGIITQCQHGHDPSNKSPRKAPGANKKKRGYNYIPPQKKSPRATPQGLIFNVWLPPILSRLE